MNNIPSKERNNLRLREFHLQRKFHTSLRGKNSLLQWSICERWRRTSGRLRSSRRWAGSCNADFSARRHRPRSHHRERIRGICRCNSADSPELILPPTPVSSLSSCFNFNRNRNVVDEIPRRLSSRAREYRRETRRRFAKGRTRER